MTGRLARLRCRRGARMSRRNRWIVFSLLHYAVAVAGFLLAIADIAAHVFGHKLVVWWPMGFLLYGVFAILGAALWPSRWEEFDNGGE